MKYEDERKETPFATRDNILDIRKHVTELCFRGLGLKRRKMPKEPRNFSEWSKESRARWIKTQEEILARQEAWDLRKIKVEEMFRSWIANYGRILSGKQRDGLISLYRMLFGDGLDEWLTGRRLLINSG